MRFLARFIVSVALISLTHTAQAGWIGTRTLTYVQARNVSAGGIGYLMTEEAILNPAGCPNTNVYEWNLDEPAGKAILSLATAALLGGKQVSIYLDDTRCGRSGRPVVTIIQLRR